MTATADTMLAASAEMTVTRGEILRILDRGTVRAREIATPRMQQVREVTGISLMR